MIVRIEGDITRVICDGCDRAVGTVGPLENHPDNNYFCSEGCRAKFIAWALKFFGKNYEEKMRLAVCESSLQPPKAEL